MKNKNKNGWLSKTVSILFYIWVSSLLFFIILFGISTRAFTTTVDKTAFGNSKLYLVLIIGTILVGSLDFVVMIIMWFIKEVITKNIIKSNNSVWGKILSFIKFVLLFAILPLFLIYQVLGISQLLSKLRNKQSGKLQDKLSISKKQVVKGILQSLLILTIMVPVWIGGYIFIYETIITNLGYSSQNISVVGTGSMYPTWPKGTKGKDPKELSKEIVSSAGFFQHPNGLVLAGKRYFDHKIERGDIVTAENDAIRKTTEKIYGESSGVLKRVVALGGDSIELKDGIVYLNDQPLKEQYVAKPHSTFGEEFLRECQRYTVPDSSAFLMGDNRKGSGDSREFGPVKLDEIKLVLPLAKQKGKLDKNWRDTTNDLVDTTKPTINRNRFVELLNEKRRENGAVPIKYEPKLEVSAKIRGEYLLKKGSLEGNASYDVVISAMSKAGYWNSYVWEWRIEGYYEAEELIEDFIERDSTDAKDVWFDKKFDDIGIAEVQGSLNGCPTQIIVVHAAGYIPPNYKQSDIDSWQPSLDGLRNIRSGWASLKDNRSFYEQHKTDVDRINEIINIRLSRIESIVSTMKANKWLSSEQNKWISEDLGLYNEQEALATKLNGK